jgi:adenosylmethionine-8-amino-7-oxononanoate aminotransferase
MFVVSTARADLSFLSPLWHHAVLAPDPSRQPVVLDRAEGIYVWDVDGNRYIDGLSTHGACILGHGRREIADAAHAQMLRGAHLAPVFGCTSPVARELAARLLDLTSKPGGSVWFSSSGSEAVETALRIALSFHLNRGEPERRFILTTEDCYHGCTMAVAALSGRPEYEHFTREIEPILIRLPATPHADESRSAQFATALAETIARIGAHRIAAFIAEPVPADKGVRVPVAGHWRAVEQILNENGILYIADEVLVGFGRTGAMFAHQSYGVSPDIVTVSKGLSSGYFPISACIATGWVAAEFDAYGGRALAVLDIIENEAVIANVVTQAPRIRDGLTAIAANSGGRVAPPTGIGMFWSVALAPDGDRRLGREVLSHCKDRGLLILANGNVAYLNLPLVTTAAEIDVILSLFAQGIDATIN